MKSKVFLTGDKHGNIKELNAFIKEGLTKNDYLIILGDFGFIWSPQETKEEKQELDLINDKDFTTIVVLGNHENYAAIANNYPKVWVDKLSNISGFWARQVRPSIFLLEQGQLFTINNKKYLTINGAASIDRYTRVEGKNWWKEEEISDIDQEKISRLVNEPSNYNNIDIVLSHDCPFSLYPYFFGIYSNGKPSKTNLFLDFVLNKLSSRELDFNWYCGHLHYDIVGINFDKNNKKRTINQLYKEFIQID